MLAMQDKPGLIQEPSLTNSDRRTTINQREDVNLLPTTQIIAPNTELLPSNMTKSQATMVNEATCSTNAVDSLNSNTNTITNSISTLSNDSNNQVSSRPQSMHSNHTTHLMAGTNNGPLATATTIAAVAVTPTYMASTTSTTMTSNSTSSSTITTTTATASTSTSTTSSTSVTNSSATTNIPRTAKRTPNDYRFGKTIGEGSFSSVYIAQDIHTRREVASKSNISI